MTESTTVIVQCNGCDNQLFYERDLPQGARERREQWACMGIYGLSYDFCNECWPKMIGAVNFVDPYHKNKSKKRA